MRAGVHTSIAGALENAAHRAHEIGCDAFQMFSANPRGWRAQSISEAACNKFCEVRAGHGLTPLAIHANYLINLAAPDAVIRALSVAAFRAELQRAIALGADYVVLHPGSARNGERGGAVAGFRESLLQAARGIQFNGLTVLVENTAGQGNVLGSSFEELAEILGGVAGEIPAGLCIDTAHLFAAGYPIHTPRGLNQTVRRLDATIGLDKVRLVHANDSKTGFGSRCDRHAHIGEGYIGADAFRRILRHPNLRLIPFICETPIDKPGDDRRNLDMIRRLGQGKKDESEVRRQESEGRRAQLEPRTAHGSPARQDGAATAWRS
ncbi:MAG TPA: deoxyribonuclease IV [Terriglobia bacterium]|nr:deoxyribonuclease IV [Terriglobia bacterium]